MLVLTRRCAESVRIAGRIRITVLKLKSGRAKLGVEAPPEITVVREEIYSRKRSKPGQGNVSGDRR
jgi:carbon storage regulator